MRPELSDTLTFQNEFCGGACAVVGTIFAKNCEFYVIPVLEEESRLWKVFLQNSVWPKSRPLRSINIKPIQKTPFKTSNRLIHIKSCTEQNIPVEKNPLLQKLVQQRGNPKRCRRTNPLQPPPTIRDRSVPPPPVPPVPPRPLAP